MKPLFEIPGREAEFAFFGVGAAMVVLLMLGGSYLTQLDEMDFFIIPGFAIATAMTLWSAVSYRRKRLAKMCELEQLEQTVREAVNNG